jgi:cytoskeletal protein CcmA (bactofilin family)
MGWRVLYILLISIWFPTLLRAIDMRAGRRIILLPGEEVQTNLYIAAGDVFFSGVVHGDLTVAGGEVVLDGTVSNDATVGGGRIQVDSAVGGDLRVAGGRVLLNGMVNGDLVIAGGIVRVLPTATIGGDVVLAGGDVILEGTLARSLRAVAGKILLNGTITGAVSVRTERLILGENANLDGALTYFAPDEAVMDSGARISGPVTFHVTAGMDQNWLRGALQRAGFAFLLVRFAMILSGALLAFFLLRKPTQELVEYALANFGREFLRGFVLFFVIPPAIFLVAITVVGVPVAFLGGLVHLSIGVLAMIYAGVVVGTLVLNKAQRRATWEVSWPAVLLGVSAIFLVRLVPYLGILVSATFFLVTFGAIYKRCWQLIRGARAGALTGVVAQSSPSSTADH